MDEFSKRLINVGSTVAVRSLLERRTPTDQEWAEAVCSLLGITIDANDGVSDRLRSIERKLEVMDRKLDQLLAQRYEDSVRAATIYCTSAMEPWRRNQDWRDLLVHARDRLFDALAAADEDPSRTVPCHWMLAGVYFGLEQIKR